MTKTGSRRRGKTNAQAKQESHEALLAAAAELFVERTRQNPFAALTVRDVCQRAGYSTGAFYGHWSDIHDFHSALERALMDEHFAEDFASMRHLAQDVDVSNPLAAVNELASLDLRLQLASKLWDAMELLQVTSHTGERRASARTAYRTIDESTANAYEPLLRRLGRKPRNPITVNEIGTILQSLIEGIGLRHRVDPEAIDRAHHANAEFSSLYALAVAGLLASLTCPLEDQDGLDTFLTAALGGEAESTTVIDAVVIFAGPPRLTIDRAIGLAIGDQSGDEFAPIIDAGAPLPATGTVGFTTAPQSPGVLAVAAKRPGESAMLMTEPRLPAVGTYDVTFLLRETGELSVTARKL